MLTAVEYNDSEFVYQTGGLAGSAAVQQLQQALARLAQAANWPAVNPGTIDGVIGAKTIGALTAVIGNLAELSSTVKTALQFALAAAMTNTTAMATARQVTEQYASYLTTAINVLAIKYTSQKPPPPAPGMPPGGVQTRVGVYTGAISPASGVASYPPGTITAFSAARGAWRIAVPKGAGLGGAQLGQGFTEVGSQKAQPAGATVIPENMFDKETAGKPWYKNWKYLVPIGVGVVGVGTGAVWLARR